MTPDDIPTTLAEALEARDWYAAAAVAIWAAVYGWRRFAPRVWERIPNGWRWVPPVALAACAGFVEAHAVGNGWRVAAFQALGAGVWAGFASMGLHSALKESPLPYGSPPQAAAPDQATHPNAYERYQR